MKHLKVNLDLKDKKIDFDGDINKLNILVGKNGTGKSVMNILIWCFNFFLSIINNITDKKKNIAVFQEILTDSFIDCKFTGNIFIEYEKLNITCSLKEGIVEDLDLFGVYNQKEYAFPLYLSKNTRTFNQILHFFKLARIVDSEQLLKLYRLYDIAYCEYTLNKLTNGIVFENEESSNMLKSFNISIKSIKLENDKILITDLEDNVKNAETLSAGNQSVLTMILANKK